MADVEDILVTMLQQNATTETNDVIRALSPKTTPATEVDHLGTIRGGLSCD